MATAASNPRARRAHVTPSLIKSETFLFTLLVIVLAVYVPYMLRSGRGAEVRYTNTTAPAIPALNIPDALGGAQLPVAGPVPLQQAPVTSGQAVPTDRRPAPITYIIPYILAGINSILSLIASIPRLVYRILHTVVFRPLGYPLAFILAVLRPITLLLEIIYAVFLRTPIAVLTWFVREAIYPLYVFTGIAAILGVSVGYSVSHVPRIAIFGVEHIRSRIATAQAASTGTPNLIVQSPSTNSTADLNPPYYGGGGFQRREPSGNGSRSVTFDDAQASGFRWQ